MDARERAKPSAAAGRAERGVSPPIALWALALGGVGFACGFFGPIALRPDANQGPLLGIFITGPGGALFGLVAGVVVKLTVRVPATRWKALFSLCAAEAIAILIGVLPPPELRARIVEGEIRGCASPAAAADAAIPEWEQRIAKVTWSPPRKGWKQDVARMLRDDPGVVLDLTVVRSRDVLANRKPWNAGTLFAKPWQASGETQKYFADFAGADCDAYRKLGRGLYRPGSDGTVAWPPDLLPNFLGLMQLGEVPAEYRRFTAE